MAVAAGDWRTRLHALWTLDGMDAVEPALVTRALGDSSRDVRAAAVRVAERWLAEPNHPIHAAVMARVEDQDWSVRQQLAASLGGLPTGPRETAVASLLERYANDPIVMDAALSGLRGVEGVVLEKLLPSATAQSEQREAAIAMLAVDGDSRWSAASIQQLFGWAADTDRPGWQRAALAARRGNRPARCSDARNHVGSTADESTPPSCAVPDLPGRTRAAQAEHTRSVRPEELGSGGGARG